jgi:hypothetical protein
MVLRIILLPVFLLLAVLPVYRLMIPLLYRGGRATRAARLNNGVWSWLASMGVLPERMPGRPVIGPATIEVRGRHSGRPRSNMVTWVEYRGQRYFVSMLGPRSDWIRNLEAGNGEAVFRHGSRRRVRLETVPPEARAPIIQAWYSRTYTSTRHHLRLERNAPTEEFARIAPGHPVYRIVFAPEQREVGR